MSYESQPMLPGFEPPKPHENKIVVAAVEQLQKLADDDVLTSDHAIVSQLVLSLSQSVGSSLASGRLTIAGVQGAKLLLEAVEQLPKTGASPLQKLLDQMLEAETTSA